MIKHCKQHKDEINVEKPPLSESCRSHSQTQHHIFLSYRVATEGDVSVHPVCYILIIYVKVMC